MGWRISTGCSRCHLVGYLTCHVRLNVPIDQLLGKGQGLVLLGECLFVGLGRLHVHLLE